MADGYPHVSIVVTSFNQGPYVEEALRSCFAQRYPLMEVFCLDNGSTDHTSEVMQAYVQRFPEHPLHFHRFRENRGICTAFNWALVRAKGKYIIDLAADDRLIPDSLASRISFFESCPDGTVLTHSNGYHMDEAGNRLDTFHSRKTEEQMPQGRILKEVMTGYWINTPSMIYNTAVLKELGGFDERLLFEDTDIVLRLAAHGLVYYQPIAAIEKRKVQSSLSQKYEAELVDSMLQSVDHILEKMRPVAQRHQVEAAFQQMIYYYVRLALRLDQEEVARRFLNYSLNSADRWYRALIALAKWGVPVATLAQWLYRITKGE